MTIDPHDPRVLAVDLDSAEVAEVAKALAAELGRAAHRFFARMHPVSPENAAASTAIARRYIKERPLSFAGAVITALDRGDPTPDGLDTYEAREALALLGALAGGTFATAHVAGVPKGLVRRLLEHRAADILDLALANVQEIDRLPPDVQKAMESTANKAVDLGQREGERFHDGKEREAEPWRDDPDAWKGEADE